LRLSSYGLLRGSAFEGGGEGCPSDAEQTFGGKQVDHGEFQCEVLLRALGKLAYSFARDTVDLSSVAAITWFVSHESDDDSALLDRDGVRR